MNEIRSKYKFFGGVGLLILINLLVTSITIIVFIKLRGNYISHKALDKGAFIAILPFIILQALALMLFMTQCKIIVLTKGHITFINPIFQFNRRIIPFHEYDYFVTIEEYTEVKNWEAIWLIKDRKIKDRISSFYYKNYSNLKDQITIENKGQIYQSPLRQTLSIFGMKIKDIP